MRPSDGDARRRRAATSRLPDGLGAPAAARLPFHAMADAATDIIMLTHNRLDHLVATVDALEQRTRAPYRLTIVDNASDPDVRNWLAENRDRFHQLILLPENEFLTALNHGIAATTSDPYMVTDPDLVVPDLEPCWLTRMRTLMDAASGLRADRHRPRPVQPAVRAGGGVDRPRRDRRRRDRRARRRQRLHADPPRRAAGAVRHRLAHVPERRPRRLPLRLGARHPRLPPRLGRLQAVSRPPRRQARARRVPRGQPDRARADAHRARPGRPAGRRDARASACPTPRCWS